MNVINSVFFLEMTQVAVNYAATTLAEMLNQPVEIGLHQSLYGSADQIKTIFDDHDRYGAVVRLAFGDQPPGMALFLLPAGNEELLLDAFTELGYQVPEESPLQSILEETGNIILNACVGTLANQMAWQVTYQPPVVDIKPTFADVFLPTDDTEECMAVASRMKVGGYEITAYIILILYAI